MAQRAESDWSRDQRCSLLIGLRVPPYSEEPMRSLHFKLGVEFSFAWKTDSALDLWNVMLSHILNRESVGVLFTFWKSLLELS